MRKKRRRRAKAREKHRKRFRVILEIALMVAGVLCSIMPQPFPLLVPIGIGVIRIISSAVQREKTEAAPPVKVYCNGEREHQTKRAPSKSTAQRSKTK